MKILFTKYHGTGNDFILIDNRSRNFDPQRKNVSYLCHRRIGIGADGLILLNNSDNCDFEMVYFNADGLEGTMCGNGGRCVVAFAKQLNIIKDTCIFGAIDGIHKGSVLGKDKNVSLVNLQMNDVSDIKVDGDSYVLDTGSPHLVKFTDQIEQYDVRSIGRNIRYSDTFRNDGINVNFVEIKNNHTLFVRTYERGVEDETLSCGTGVVASAVAYALKTGLHIEKVQISTLGGLLNVKFKQKKNNFTEVFLNGPATRVFEGSLDENALKL